MTEIAPPQNASFRCNGPVAWRVGNETGNRKTGLGCRWLDECILKTEAAQRNGQCHPLQGNALRHRTSSKRAQSTFVLCSFVTAVGMPASLVSQESCTTAHSLTAAAHGRGREVRPHSYPSPYRSSADLSKDSHTAVVKPTGDCSAGTKSPAEREALDVRISALLRDTKRPGARKREGTLKSAAGCRLQVRADVSWVYSLFHDRYPPFMFL